MIEILDINNIPKIKNLKLYEYLLYSIKRLPNDFIYPNYGYFIIVEDIKDLQQDTLQLSYNNISIDGLNKDFIRNIELIEQKDDVIEILILIDNDFGVSFIIDSKIINKNILSQLLANIHNL